jgi:Kdo2-lipid IVA lauroyltransferase/acyltransferase
VSRAHALEAWLVRGLAAGLRALPRNGALGAGVSLGEVARWLGLRREVAEANLTIAFPEKPAAERAAILTAHYRELGRVVAEYPRLPELVQSGGDQVVARVGGLEHLEAAHARGHGVILLTGHYGNFELLGAWLGRMNPVDFVVKPLSNPAVEAQLAAWRTAAGVGAIPIGAAMRGAFRALRARRWIAMLADQDARRAGTFVPFFGRPTSTAAGPAELSLRTGAPIVMGFVTRRLDGRLELDVEAPLEGAGATPEAARDLTARHTARLEAWVRRQPAQWFWLHRRWKTPPPAAAEDSRGRA